MKIGIVTINSAYNYGCVLQAWSLQRFLEKEGYEAEIINFRLPAIDNVYRLFRKRERFSGRILNGAYNGLRRIKFSLTQRDKIAKAKKFENFIAHVMHTTAPYTSMAMLEEENVAANYDVLITGSDQVWNSTITKGLQPAYFLAFDHAGKKKLSYAASIGKTELTNAEKDFMAYFLQDYQSISVREQSAREMLQPLVKQPVTVVLDPTLLLTRDDFDQLKKPSKYNKPYILVHIIGKDARLEKIVNQVSGQTGLPVVHNRGTKKYPNELGRFSDAGPEEFIGLVESAALVITNSFHATVFSIMYERNFITIPHKLYPERMVNLLTETKLENHLIDDAEKLPERIEELQPDYAGVRARLNQRQEECREYLRRRLAE